VERIYEVERAVPIHGLAEGHRRCPLGDANLQDGATFPNMLRQSSMFRCSMLRDRRPQPGPGKKRMFQQATWPWLVQARISVNVYKPNIQFHLAGLRR
jgi:hypothetical protein